ncbi:MAG: hypothetical protein EP329_00415 [Deltaproteobacteria bacterium]|nr:MAG: hypothetical protein EP329_00415 [Deltaproteobacteria bacterium]
MRRMTMLRTGALAMVLGAALVSSGCLESGAGDPNLNSSALHNGDASDSSGGAYADSYGSDDDHGDSYAPGYGDSYGPGYGDSYGPGYGDSYGPGYADADAAGGDTLHACVVALVDCLFEEPRELCEERFAVCYAGDDASAPPDVDPGLCEHELEACLGATPADPDACFAHFDACMQGEGQAPPDPAMICDERFRACMETPEGPEDPARCEEELMACLDGLATGPPAFDPALCEQELDACLQGAPEDPEPCLLHFDACLQAGAPPAPQDDPVRACEEQLDACMGGPEGPMDPEHCMIMFEQCLQAAAGDPGAPPTDADPNDPAQVCEPALDACVQASPGDPEPCFDAFVACMESFATPGDPGPSHPDPALCEETREGCLADGRSPEQCDAAFDACMSE